MAIRVLVVDDSPFMRKSLQKMLETAPDIQVVGTARDGMDALEKIEELDPDLVTLDIEMPRMDGLTALKKIMATSPRAVLMVSSLTQEGAQATLDALSLGALDFIPKESSFATMSILNIQQELQEKIRRLASTPRFKRPQLDRSPRPGAPAPAVPIPPPPAPRPIPRPGALELAAAPMAELIVLGSSTGGPKALQELLPALPGNLPVPLLIVQHMPSTFTKPFADRLNTLCQVTVKEAEHGEPIKAGTVYIARGGIHMVYRQRGAQPVLELSLEPTASIHRPSVDVLFQSVHEQCNKQVLAVILTGMGNDGAKGMELLKQKGAHTLAEAEETCVVYGMPRAAAEKGCVDVVAPLQDIAGHLRRHFRI
ncbi:MAG TPA: chemotaxis response regulator protein-glutamate methylesterase [Holophagaceae bacterium]|nr:chemotaxis response regulator protein-glutamate methylesterase [Holophagaceae bacterium]